MNLAHRMISRILCRLGMHGPNFFGNTVRGHRSMQTAPFERTCTRCGAVWHGKQIENSYMRTVGGWRRATNPRGE